MGVLLALTGCTSTEGTGDKGYVTGSGQVREVAAGERGDPVDLDGRDLDGEPVSLAGLRGRPVVVVVWYAQCPPCRSEAPDVVSVATELGDRAAFVGLNVRDESPERARAFERTFAVPYPTVYSPDGTALLSLRGTLTPMTVPAFLVLDPQGRVSSSIIGELPSPTTLRALVEDVLPARPAEAADG